MVVLMTVLTAVLKSDHTKAPIQARYRAWNAVAPILRDAIAHSSLGR